MASYVAPSAPAMPTLSAASRKVIRIDFVRRLYGLVTSSVRFTMPGPSVAAQYLAIATFFATMPSLEYGVKSLYVPLPWRNHTTPSRFFEQSIRPPKSYAA